MCYQSKDLDPALWDVEPLVVEIDGETATLELEMYFWRKLETLAEREHISLSELVRQLYDFAIANSFTNGTFPGFLRVFGCRLVADDLPSQ